MGPSTTAKSRHVSFGFRGLGFCVSKVHFATENPRKLEQGLVMIRGRIPYYVILTA